MEQHLKNYQINHNFQEKGSCLGNIIVGNWEKGKRKTKNVSETT